MSVSTVEMSGMVDAIFSAKDSNEVSLAEFASMGGCVVFCKQVADSLAADTSDVGFLGVPASPAVNQLKVVKCSLMPQASLTADDTDFVTLSVVYDDGAAGSESIVASVTTKITGGSGNWTGGQVVNVPISAQFVPAGKQLKFKVAKTGAGQAVPITTLSVQYISF